MHLSLINENSILESVLLGRADQMGPDPDYATLYDPKSKAHLLAGTYPKEAALMGEMAAFKTVQKNTVSKSFNQIPFRIAIRFSQEILALSLMIFLSNPIYCPYGKVS